ncbi:MAG: TolC family protein, partial [Nannocystaceae bacterium]
MRKALRSPLLLTLTLALAGSPGQASAAPAPAEPTPADDEAGESPENAAEGPAESGEGRIQDPPEKARKEPEARPEPELPEHESSTVDERINAKRMRLPEAIRLALEQHPQIMAASERTKAARARVGQAKSAYMPRVDTYLQYLRASENGSLASFHSVPGMARVGGSIRDGVRWNDSFNNFLAAVVAQQAIYDFGRTQGAVGAAEAAVKVARMEEELIEQIVVFDVVSSFYEVRNARENVRVAEEALVNARAIFELAEAGVGAGLRPESEQARAEADVAGAEVAMIQARLSLDVSRARVANALGATGESFEPADEELPPPAPLPTVTESIDEALAKRPELRALEYQQEILGQNLRATKAKQRPRIDAITGVNTRGQFLPTAGQDPYARFNWHVGLVVQIPVFQGMRVRREKEEIQAQIRALESQHRAVREAVMLEIRQAVAFVAA